MNAIQAMRVFVRVADAESFRGAARGLGVSNALVSRAIALLEAHLGTRLIDRTTRDMSLTDSGARYLEGCRAVLEELDYLESTIASGEVGPSGTLRVVASSALSPLTLTQLVDGFRKLYRGVTIRLTLAEGHVDFVERGYDVGILMGLRDSAALRMRPAGASVPVAVATPAFLAEHGLPGAPAELQRLPLVGLLDERRNETWHFRHPHGDTEPNFLDPVYSVNSVLLVRLATLSNMGFSILPSSMIWTDLEEGARVRLLPNYSIDEPGMTVSVVHPAHKYLPRKVRVFAKYAQDYLSRELATTTGLCNVSNTLALQQPASIPDAAAVPASAA